MSLPARVRAERHGRFAERTAALWLRLKGYRVLARRYRTPVGEIDVVARTGSTLAFVEVKAREDFPKAAHSVTPRQRERIERAALLFLSRRPDLARLTVRFDVLFVAPWRFPKHLADAWRATEKPTR